MTIVVFLTPLTPQVLRFYAYFQEAVHEKREEQFRIRNSIILFYLEDDTIQVNEPKVENSGVPQGEQDKPHRQAVIHLILALRLCLLLLF